MLSTTVAARLTAATVFADDEPSRSHVFHVRPDLPTWRLDDAGTPRVRLVVHRARADRPDMSAGGLLLVETVLTVPDEALQELRHVLQAQVDARASAGTGPPREVELVPVPFTRVGCTLSLPDLGRRPSAVEAGAVSAYGQHVATFSVPLTPEQVGAVEAALRSSGSSGLDVAYEVTWLAGADGLITHAVDRVAAGLPALAGMRDRAGGSIDVDRLVQRLDRDTDFFEQVRVDVLANADFVGSPVAAVQVWLDYGGQPMRVVGAGPAAPAGTAVLEDADTVVRFVSARVPGVDSWSLRYEVAYRGQSRLLRSGVVSSPIADAVHVIGVGDTGVLDVTVHAGDIDFDEVSWADVVLRYADPDSDVLPLTTHVVLDRQTRSHRWQEVLFAPRRLPYEATVRFMLVDGTELVRGPTASSDGHLRVDDPFTGRRSVTLRAVGEFAGAGAAVQLDLVYVEPAGYSRTQTVLLDVTQPVGTWTVSVVDGTAGVLTYSGTAWLSDGRVVPVPTTVVTALTVLVGPQRVLRIEVVGDLLDFDRVALVDVLVTGQGDVAAPPVVQVSVDATTPRTWVDLPTTSPTGGCTWSATYVLADGTRRVVGPVQDESSVIVLELPD